MEDDAQQPKNPSVATPPNATCVFSTASEEWLTAHWHGCGLPIDQHVQETYGRFVSYRPSMVPWPCFVVDADPDAEHRAETREEARQRAARELNALRGAV